MHSAALAHKNPPFENWTLVYFMRLTIIWVILYHFINAWGMFRLLLSIITPKFFKKMKTVWLRMHLESYWVSNIAASNVFKFLSVLNCQVQHSWLFILACLSSFPWLCDIQLIIWQNIWLNHRAIYWPHVDWGITLFFRVSKYTHSLPGTWQMDSQSWHRLYCMICHYLSVFHTSVTIAQKTWFVLLKSPLFHVLCI